MTTEQRELLLQTVADVLERFSFMFSDPEELGADQWKGEYLHSTITFDGPSQGALTITAPEPLCRDIAGNTLGEMDTDDISAETCEDALKEMLNIICGEFVAELYGTKVLVNLTVPSMTRIDKGKWLELSAGEDNMKLMVEGNQLLVSLLIADE
jgi:CheY-specific phosphatase CheX